MVCQSTGIFRTLNNLFSSVLSKVPISDMYSHLAVDGKLINILSILAPPAYEFKLIFLKFLNANQVSHLSQI